MSPLAVLALLLACPAEPTSWRDCEEMEPGERADECWARFAAELFREDRAHGEEVVRDRVTDERVRDFIWLAVTRDVFPDTFAYCERIREPALRERCGVIVRRPHLHRALHGADDAPPARPPPAVPPGGGPERRPPPPAGGPPPSASARP